MTAENILIVEDDIGIQKMLELYFKKRNYQVQTANNGEEAMKVIKHNPVNLIVLDVEMPMMDGYVVCQKVREITDIPIIFISNNRMLEDKLRGLNLGGDDYVTKPFDFDELHARIKSNLRRYQLLNQSSSSYQTKDGTFQFNYETKECYVNGSLIELTEIETEILTLLISRENQVLDNSVIFDYVWGYDHIGNPLTVRAHMRNLRSKIEEDPANPKYIKTVRGFGYRFSSEENQ